MQLFNSKNNYSENLTIVIDDFLISPDNLNINEIFNQYIEMDFSLENVLDIEKMERVKELNLLNGGKVLVYPDYTDKNTFFTLFVNSFIDFNLKNKKYKFYCDKLCILTKNNTVISDFNGDYSDFTVLNTVNDDEIALIKKYNSLQYKSGWFNDQNVFVENEYNRIQRLITKPHIKSANNGFDASTLKVSRGALDPMSDLDKIIGLEDIKHEIKRLKATLEYKRNNPNINVNESLHMCFYGNPGTGKTTMARIIAGILYDLGFIKQNKVIEVNGLELKGANVGQTSVITKGTIDYALGGVLFIDEAYTLFDSSENNFGIEAINLLLKEMEDNRDNLVVILAGYRKPMQRLLDSNVGFRSRVKYYFDFKDYSSSELFEIFMQSLRNKHLYINEDAMEDIIIDLKNARLKKNFGNGRYVENMISKIEEEHVLNVDKEISKADIISVNDIKEGGDIFEV